MTITAMQCGVFAIAPPRNSYVDAVPLDVGWLSS